MSTEDRNKRTRSPQLGLPRKVEISDRLPLYLMNISCSINSDIVEKHKLHHVCF